MVLERARFAPAFASSSDMAFRFIPLILGMLLLQAPLHGQESNVYYVIVDVKYKYPGTDWVSSPGDVEQVIAESATAYTVVSTDGDSLVLPINSAHRVTAEEAAAAFMIERQKNEVIFQSYEDEIRALQGNQSPKESTISKARRRTMERTVWTAGLAESLYAARQMTDEQLSSLFPRAQQIVEIRKLNR